MPVVDIKVRLNGNLETNPFATRAKKREIENALAEQVKSEIIGTLEVQKQIDILNIYEKFHRFNTRALKKFLENNDFDTFLSCISYNVIVQFNL